MMERAGGNDLMIPVSLSTTGTDLQMPLVCYSTQTSEITRFQLYVTQVNSHAEFWSALMEPGASHWQRH